VLIRVAASSLNPLEYKLAELNFFGRTPPVILGLDLECRRRWVSGYAGE
jgi:NADPH:quinone reductase-like Zn-dependent oxidoreductase